MMIFSTIQVTYVKLAITPMTTSSGEKFSILKMIIQIDEFYNSSNLFILTKASVT